MELGFLALMESNRRSHSRQVFVLFVFPNLRYLQMVGKRSVQMSYHLVIVAPNVMIE